MKTVYDRLKSVASTISTVMLAIQRKYLHELMFMNSGRINKSAEMAGISTRQLHKLLTRYGISKEKYKKTHNNFKTIPEIL
jgi:DNA-binding NtrC family response regulator